MCIRDRLSPMSSKSFEQKLCLLYTSDAADDGESVDLGGRRIIKKIFFFQAEDGNPDLRLSCGLRDVYKRQGFFNDTATTEIYTLSVVGSVRCV
ncbi:hypothetical protein JMUB7531_28820 [Staphylococcus aureus]